MMFGPQPLDFTLITANAIPRFHIAQGSAGTNYCGLAILKTNALVGVVQNEPLAGEHATICPIGKTKAVAGGSVTAYSRVTCTTSGRLAAAASGDVIVGYALETSAADGDIITVMANAFQDKMIA